MTRVIALAVLCVAAAAAPSGATTYHISADGLGDFPTIQGVILLFSFVYVGINLLVDLSYAWFDPRIRLDGGKADR